LHWEKEGAYTGEINAAMLVSVGVTQSSSDTPNAASTSAKPTTASTSNSSPPSKPELIPIVRVGEVLEERERPVLTGRRFCAASVLRAFNKVSAKKAASLVVAYEPVWAIGTGKTATPQMAADRPPPLSEPKPLNRSARSSPTNCRILYGGLGLNRRTPML